jgi:hypothetical protein
MTNSHPPQDDDIRIVEVYSAANEIDAGAVRAALDDAGIEARLVGDLAGNAFDIPLGVSAPKLWVREDDVAAALRVIEQLQDQMGAEFDDPNLKTEPDDGSDSDDGGE